ncbi:MAG TPA: hypothetical protein VH561_17685 [Micromonosporaceae bacterium]|jgi:hypothetical protein
MTTKADFTPDEWELIVQAPRWVVAAASAAQRDVGYRTNHEIEQGFVATAHGRDTGNAFTAEVAIDTLKVFDSRTVVTGTEFQDRAAGLAAALEKVAVVDRLLAEKADTEDAQAYRRWLIAITDVVIRAARSHDIVGFGGELVTQAEKDFRDQLVLALQH